MNQLFTSRVGLRRLKRSDLSNIARLQTDPEVVKFTRARVPQTLAQIESRLAAWIEAEASNYPLGIWAAELREGSEFIGWFMLMKSEFEFPELGFMILREYWGKGLTTEVSRALIDFAFRDLGLQGASAVTDCDNMASIHVLEKLGFQRVEFKSKHDPILGREVELCVFQLKVSGG